LIKILHLDLSYDSKLLVSSNGRYVVTIDSNYIVNKYDKIQKTSISTHLPDAINSAMISPDSRAIICACDNLIQALDIDTLALLCPTIEYQHSSNKNLRTPQSNK